MDFSIFGSFDTSFWVKMATLGAIVFYGIFAFVIFTQVRVMGRILHLSHGSSTLQAISIINALVAISLFIIAVVIL